MKHLNKLLVFFSIILFLASCTSTRNATSDSYIQKRKYNKGYYVNHIGKVEKKQNSKAVYHYVEQDIEISNVNMDTNSKAEIIDISSDNTPKLEIVEEVIISDKIDNSRQVEVATIKEVNNKNITNKDKLITDNKARNEIEKTPNSNHHPKLDILALLALVFAVFSLLFLFLGFSFIFYNSISIALLLMLISMILAILGFILGIISLVRTINIADRYKGKAIAIIGSIISAAILLLMVIWFNV